jgi:hypothetical protein
MLILSALLRAVYAIVRLGVRVAGSVEIGRSYRNSAMPKRSPPLNDEWLRCPYNFDEVDWYQTVPEHQSPFKSRYADFPKSRRPKAAMPEDQPVDSTTGRPSGPPVVRPQEPE